MRAGYLIMAVAGQGARSSQARERWLFTSLRRQLQVLRDGNRQRTEWIGWQTVLTYGLRHERHAIPPVEQLFSRNLDVLRIQFHHCCRPKSVQTVHSFVPKIHAFVLATPPQVWLNIQRCAPGRAFLLSTSSIASHERVSLTWVAMYHVFPNASRTAAFRSPYGWSAGS